MIKRREKKDATSERGSWIRFFFSFLSPHPSSSRKIFDLSVQLLCKFDLIPILKIFPPFFFYRVRSG